MIVIKLDIISLFDIWKFDYSKYAEDIIRIGDLTAIRFLKGKPYRRNYERALLLLGLAKKIGAKTFFEFGTGRGFCSAVMAQAELKVYTVDNESHTNTKAIIKSLGINVNNITFIKSDSKK